MGVLKVGNVYIPLRRIAYVEVLEEEYCKVCRATGGRSDKEKCKNCDRKGKDQLVIYLDVISGDGEGFGAEPIRVPVDNEISHEVAEFIALLIDDDMRVVHKLDEIIKGFR